jgi:hypothetical protein
MVALTTLDNLRTVNKEVLLKGAVGLVTGARVCPRTEKDYCSILFVYELIPGSTVENTNEEAYAYAWAPCEDVIILKWQPTKLDVGKKISSDLFYGTGQKIAAVYPNQDETQIDQMLNAETGTPAEYSAAPLNCFVALKQPKQIGNLYFAAGQVGLVCQVSNNGGGSSVVEFKPEYEQSIRFTLETFNTTTLVIATSELLELNFGPAFDEDEVYRENLEASKRNPFTAEEVAVREQELENGGFEKSVGPGEAQQALACLLASAPLPEDDEFSIYYRD